MDAITLHRRAVASWLDRVAVVGDTQWAAPTPCAEWSVRDLVNHVVGEDRWTEPLVAGRTIEEVGHALDGDLLGHEPVGAARSAAEQALQAVAEHAPARQTVHLSYGAERTDEYLTQLAADHLIHGWDLAAATGGATRLDPELVDVIAAWFSDREEMMRSAGAIAERPAVDTDDPQARLLAAFGRRSDWTGPAGRP